MMTIIIISIIFGASGCSNQKQEYTKCMKDYKSSLSKEFFDEHYEKINFMCYDMSKNKNN
jgi:hypothetical protein